MSRKEFNELRGSFKYVGWIKDVEGGSKYHVVDNLGNDFTILVYDK